MNNKDMPAMPLTGDAYQDFAAYDETNKTSYNPECQGLTKREQAAIQIIAGLDIDTFGSKEQMAQDAVELADALFAELDKRGGE